ncbi:MAG: excinuclease ABC subunit UvrB [Eubacteriales bacterium]|nr:excinuclease ABC subunit UvrB [Eubacteriales bacterium]
MDGFVLESAYKPTGDQPKAIEKLTEGIIKGYKNQVLLGVTGSGKTFTMANIIANVNKPTLVLAHNKTLAAQLCSEFKEYFPHNAVEYFVSYYDYYQPEAYVPGKDVYIEKDSSINKEIDKLRHSATSALFERKDVIIVSSVSCIYSLGDPEEYRRHVVSLRAGMKISRDDVIKRLVAIQYVRGDMDFVRNTFRVRGDTVEIFPSNTDSDAVRAEFWGDEVERISVINTTTGEAVTRLQHVSIYPASHYVTSEELRERALMEIEKEKGERAAWFEEQGKFIEAQRIVERVNYDIEQIREIGYCSGVENYSRVLSGREPGSTPYTLLDYFPSDYLMFIDESHVTVPQVRGMSRGDTARKKNLIDYGFRLPSAYDNRPLRFEEYLEKKGQTLYISATPAEYEKSLSDQIAEQIIRPTGLIDPQIEVRPVKGQIDDLIGEIKDRAAKNERVLITTLTKHMAEDLSDYMENYGMRCRYMHYDIETIERMEILRDLRKGEFDVLIGINLLREGLDLPEVSLVAILDADKEGFLRSESSLIQIIGRTARNVNGKVIMYADNMTNSMDRAIRETNRRREIQHEYNTAHGITPKTIIKEIRMPLAISSAEETKQVNISKLNAAEKKKIIEKLVRDMKQAAKELDFESAALIRDRIKRLMD